jgi:anti-sigma regulatory factor (Ser/Thr protein kinase)
VALQLINGPESHEFIIELPNTPSAAVHARKQLVRFIEHFRVAPHILAEIETVAGEALANAAEHGYRLRGTLRIHAKISRSCLEVTISDDGPGFETGPISLDHPKALAPRGYGLFMMKTFVDVLEFRDNGRAVWFLKRF